MRLRLKRLPEDRPMMADLGLRLGNVYDQSNSVRESTYIHTKVPVPAIDFSRPEKRTAKSSLEEKKNADWYIVKPGPESITRKKKQQINPPVISSRASSLLVHASPRTVSAKAYTVARGPGVPRPSCSWQPWRVPTALVSPSHWGWGHRRRPCTHSSQHQRRR